MSQHKMNTYRSTPGQMREFKESSLIWQDMQQELNTWISRGQVLLEDPNLDIDATNGIRGSIRAARDMLCLPDVILGIMEAEEKTEN